MTVHYILAAQHQTPLTPQESLQCAGFDGKSSPTSHGKSQSRSHAPRPHPWQMEHARCLRLGQREVSTRQFKLLSKGGNDKGKLSPQPQQWHPAASVIRPILQHDPAHWVSDHTPSFLDISSIFKAAQFPPKNFFFLHKLARVCYRRTSKLLFYNQFLVCIIKSIIQQRVAKTPEQDVLVLSLGLLPTSCVIFSKSLHTLCLSFSICKIRIVIVANLMVVSCQWIR